MKPRCAAAKPMMLRATGPFLTNARDDEESSEGAEERRDALEAAALTKRIVAIAMETRAIVNRVRKKLIEAGFVDVEALTPYDPEA